MPSQRWLHPTLALLCALTLLVPLAAADEAKAATIGAFTPLLFASFAQAARP